MGQKGVSKPETIHRLVLQNPAINVVRFCSVWQWSSPPISVLMCALKIQNTAPGNVSLQLLSETVLLCYCLNDFVAQMQNELEENRLCSSRIFEDRNERSPQE